ncbi:MAG: glycosyltransferase family 4 protein [Candidatus Gracilibacteria bacterium]|nr:glycosyltransferase family 4 protein [Candidatus Gracilibacteria bacterium]
MKIAILHSQAKIKGGAVKTLFLTANELKNDHDVDFYTFSFDKDNCFPDLNKDLNIINLNLSGAAKIFGIIRLGFKLKGYDMVFAGNSPMHFAGALAKTLNPKLKVFWYLQNIPLYYMEENRSLLTSIKKMIERSLVISKVNIISNSLFIKNKVKEYFRKDSSLLYPCIDVDFFRKTDSTEEQYPSLFINSRFVSGKNIELAIRSFIALKDEFPGLKLFIAGDGDEKEKLMKMSDNEKNIIFLGEISPDKVNAYYNMATVFLFTSVIDAFGLTIIEAMSVGKPVVSVSVGGPLEIIENGINGFLAEDESDFISKIELLLGNESLRTQIGNNARLFVKEKFSLAALRAKLDMILF